LSVPTATVDMRVYNQATCKDTCASTGEKKPRSLPWVTVSMRPHQQAPWHKTRAPASGRAPAPPGGKVARACLCNGAVPAGSWPSLATAHRAPGVLNLTKGWRQQHSMAFPWQLRRPVCINALTQTPGLQTAANGARPGLGCPRPSCCTASRSRDWRRWR